MRSKELSRCCYKKTNKRSKILELTVNGEVDCQLKDGILTVQPLNKLSKYTLQELIAQELEKDPEIEWGQAMGEEEW